MRKLFLFVLLFCFLGVSIPTFFPTSVALADQVYLRVINDNTPFYSKPTDSEPLFFLPYTYYVSVIDDGKDFTHVECLPSNGAPLIDGYVPTDMLYLDNLPVIEPFINLKIKTATTALLFIDSTLSSPIQYVFPEREMTYYGKYINQAGFVTYYVSYNNHLGYVKESDVYPFAMPNHQNELTFIKSEEPPVETLPESPQTSHNDATLSIKIIVIACLVFSGIVGLIFAIKHKPTRASAVTFYDENDYE